MSLLAHDDRGAGVLAHGQDAAGGDVGVLQEIPGDEMVVGRGVLVVQDACQLPQMCRPQQMGAIVKGLCRQLGQPGAFHGQDVGAVEFFDTDMVRRERPVFRRVVVEREHFVIAGFGHRVKS